MGELETKIKEIANNLFSQNRKATLTEQLLFETWKLQKQNLELLEKIERRVGIALESKEPAIEPIIYREEIFSIEAFSNSTQFKKLDLIQEFISFNFYLSSGVAGNVFIRFDPNGAFQDITNDITLWKDRFLTLSTNYLEFKITSPSLLIGSSYTFEFKYLSGFNFIMPLYPFSDNSSGFEKFRWARVDSDGHLQIDVVNTAPIDVRDQIFSSVDGTTATFTITASALPSIVCKGALIQADYDNTDKIFIGDSTTQDVEMKAGDVMTLNLANTNLLYAKSNIGTQRLNILTGNYT